MDFSSSLSLLGLADGFGNAHLHLRWIGRVSRPVYAPAFQCLDQEPEPVEIHAPGTNRPANLVYCVILI
jgi:hypothetical protein